MVRILEAHTAAGDDLPFLVFRPYRSFKDRSRILGRVESRGVIHGNQCTFINMPFGVPVAEAFQQTLAIAEWWGVDSVWVNDPKGLFPPASRPAVASH